MKKQKNKLELLAPAGNFKCLLAAIDAGADAIYFGLKNFNMRSRAKNFNISDLPKISKLCKEKNIKKYLTLNTIIYDNELKKLESTIKKVKPYINAIICSDFAVINLCKKYKIPFHISTQMSISNIESAKFFKKLGAERLVLARELNLSQIKKISKIIPVEIFIHGAMCISVSGRCHLSEYSFNQSANRGNCIQPCRRPYHVKDNQGNELRINNNYILSPKDLCTLPIFEKLKQAGITSFKIEGRNKEPEYVKTVTKVYRKAIDNKLEKPEISNLLKQLKTVYNKGFSTGFIIKPPTSDDLSNLDHSNATQSKQFIGKINKYFPKISVGQIKLNASSLKLNDEIYIISNEAGLIKHKINSMQINKKPIKIAIKGQEVGIKLPKCKKGDEIYKIIRKK